MRNGFKVFDADAHVIEPMQWRVGSQLPIPARDSFRPATVDGRFKRSHLTLCGDHLEAVRRKQGAMVPQDFEEAGA